MAGIDITEFKDELTRHFISQTNPPWSVIYPLSAESLLVVSELMSIFSGNIEAL